MKGGQADSFRCLVALDPECIPYLVIDAAVAGSLDNLDLEFRVERHVNSLQLYNLNR